MPRAYQPTIEEEWDAQWDALVEEASELEGRYGSERVWDAERKAFLLAIQHRLRGEYALKKVSVTEARLSEEAHCDDEYQAYVAATIMDRAKLFRQNKALQKMGRQYFRESARAKQNARLG